MRARLSVLLLISACSEPAQQDRLQPDTQTVITRFDPAAIDEGDSVAGLVLSRKDAVVNAASPVGVTGSLRFSGEIELKGEYRAHFDFPEVKKPCFWVDRTDWRKLPRVQKETRIVWFCFENDSSAIAQLGPPSKDRIKTRIVVDDYTTNLFESDVWDSARLVRVIKSQ